MSSYCAAWLLPRVKTFPFSAALVPLNVSTDVGTVGLFPHRWFLDRPDDDVSVPPDVSVDRVDAVLLDDFARPPLPVSDLVMDSTIFVFVFEWYSVIICRNDVVHMVVNKITLIQYENPDVEYFLGLFIG